MNHKLLLPFRVALGVAAVVIMAALPSVAQTSSPYSKFGYGLLGDNATSTQRQMGGTGYAMHSGRQINAMNPASYAYCDSMTFLFDIGTDLSMFWRKDSEGSHHDLGGGIDYITMQAPLSRTVGFSAGLVPYSSVGYSFGSAIENGISAHNGNGGINQLYAGLGWTPFKGFSIGFNASYLFGNMTHDVYAYATSGTTATFEQIMDVRDYHFRLGAQYTYAISRQHSVTLGVSYDPGKTLLGKTYLLKYTSSSDVDTVAPGVVKLKGKFDLAPLYGGGIAYDWRDRVHAEVDVTYQPWGSTKYTQLDNFSETRLANRYKIAAGASYVPDPRGGYLKRIAYRAGAFYNRDYIMVGSNHVRDYGVSCGVGFPTASSKTIINLGFEYRNRQATPVALLKEQYFNITLGVNFNQVWFFRNKIR